MSCALLPTMLDGSPAAVRVGYQNARGVVWPRDHLASNLMITAVKPG